MTLLLELTAQTTKNSNNNNNNNEKSFTELSTGDFNGQKYKVAELNEGTNENDFDQENTNTPQQ